jgi:GTP-binding protein HflX
VFNKCDLLDAGERARLTALYAGALTVSAISGDGRDELVSALESRLGLDTTTMTFELNPLDAEERALIAQLYRVGRILRHVAVDGHVTIEAEVPRRLLDRLRPAARAS